MQTLQYQIQDIARLDVATGETTLAAYRDPQATGPALLGQGVGGPSPALPAAPDASLPGHSPAPNTGPTAEAPDGLGIPVLDSHLSQPFSVGLPDLGGTRLAGVYRVDMVLYSTAGLAESEPFTLLFDYEADPIDVASAIDSMYEEPTCLGDLDESGSVDGGDLTQILADWGTNSVISDLSGNGVVGGEDLTILLGRWGLCSN